jgi:predicted small lipoprotein YifL
MLRLQEDSEPPMNLRHPAARVLALVALLAVTLSVAACGRRGPLELPPGATATAPDGQTATTATDPTAGTPAARRRIPLDVILD